MAQTTTYSLIPAATSGYRLVVQQGTHAFTTTATTVTLTTNLHRVVAAVCTPEQVASQKHTSLVGAYVPYVSTTMFTIAGLPNKGRVVISRKRGNISGLKFSYTLVGW